MTTMERTSAAGRTTMSTTTADRALDAAASRAIDASRQAGVLNPGELARDIHAAQARDPVAGAALLRAVNKQLSDRDRAGLAEALTSVQTPTTMAAETPTLAAVAGARAAPALSPGSMPPQGLSIDQFADVSQTVRAKAADMGLGADIVVQGSRASRSAQPGSDLDLAIRVSPDRFERFLNTDSRLATPNPGSSAERTRLRAEAEGIVQRGEARLSSTGRAIEQRIGLDVDLSVVRRGGNFDQDPTLALRGEPGPRALAGAGLQGAVVGGITDATLTAAQALRDGQFTGQEARDLLAQSARGALVGGIYAVTEQGLVRAVDRGAGTAIEIAAARTAARAGVADTALAGAMTRTAATRLAGAGAAGAIVSAGLSIVENREGLARGDSQAIGRVAGDVAVGTSAVLAGAAAGAAIGSVVPVAGTAVGAVVGLVAGVATDYVLRAGGVDQAVAQLATSAVDGVKGAAGKVASWLGW